jgi:ABC-2 type transport system ATP-binding protein
MTMADIAALSIENVTMAYGRKTVMENLSLSVGRGETFGLMGLNGAGKTTLIKAILGLRTMNAGTASIMGQASSSAAARRQLAYLPERFDPPPFLSGMEFVRFSLGLYGTKFNADAVRDFARRLALDPAVLGSRVQTYSKGMRQKLGLMATLMTGCPLLVLDEPMSGLDPLARACLKDTLREARQAGRTVFLSSHVLSDMNEICDRVAILHEGRIEFIGTPEALRAQTGNENIERAFLKVIGVGEAA